MLHSPRIQEQQHKAQVGMRLDYTPFHHAREGMKYSNNSNGVAVHEQMKELHKLPSSQPQLRQQRVQRQQPRQQRTVCRNSQPCQLFERLCSYENLYEAFIKAKKRKTSKTYVLEFEENLESNLLQLRHELLFHIYRPKELKVFVVRDPKTRVIGKSDFRDRVIHHAVINVIQDLFEKSFIHDSFANQIGKGTLKAHERFDHFKRKFSKNNTRTCYVLKCDIRKYFETVDHQVLLSILAKRVHDSRVMHLVKVILANHKTKVPNKGMPLGNLTSQFFANVYLNELDQFVKHNLKATYYIRYVDDFVILHHDKGLLESYKASIDYFLTEKLKLLLHPNKSHILKLHNGIPFLGFRVFYHHKLLRPMNRRKFERKLKTLKALYQEGIIEKEDVSNSLAGWTGYAMHANTYKYRTAVLKQIDSWEVV